MFTNEFDRERRLLKITVAGHVSAEEASACLEDLRVMLADVQMDFRLLANLGEIQSMPSSTVPYVSAIMDLCAGKGLKLVVRIPPREPRNDVGYAILSRFHYGPEVVIVTCENMEEAEEQLEQ